MRRLLPPEQLHYDGARIPGRPPPKSTGTRAGYQCSTPAPRSCLRNERFYTVHCEVAGCQGCRPLATDGEDHSYKPTPRSCSRKERFYTGFCEVAGSCQGRGHASRRPKFSRRCGSAYSYLADVQMQRGLHARDCSSRAAHRCTSRFPSETSEQKSCFQTTFTFLSHQQCKREDVA